MGKLLKYEFIRESKKMMVLFAIMSIANIFLFTRIGIWSYKSLIIISNMVNFSAVLFAGICAMMMFSKDIYDDSGYLTYTLPISGYAKVGTNLIVTIVNVVITGIISTVFSVALMGLYTEINLKVINWFKAGWVLFQTALIGISFVVSVYFAIVLTRVLFKKIRMEKLTSVGIWIAVTTFSTWIINKIAEWNPILIQIDNVAKKQYVSNIMFTEIIYSPKGTQMNLTQNIFIIIFTVAMFILTSYMLDEKIDI